VLSSHATAANATLPGHNERGWGKKKHWRRLQKKIRRNPMKKEEHEK